MFSSFVANLKWVLCPTHNEYQLLLMNQGEQKHSLFKNPCCCGHRHQLQPAARKVLLKLLISEQQSINATTLPHCIVFVEIVSYYCLYWLLLLLLLFLLLCFQYGSDTVPLMNHGTLPVICTHCAQTFIAAPALAFIRGHFFLSFCLFCHKLFLQTDCNKTHVIWKI